MTESLKLIEEISDFLEAKTVTGIELGTSGGDHYFADVTPGKSIRIYGDKSGGNSFDVTFEKGDLAEYDSYNFSYIGRIESITAKTVTIQPGYGTHFARKEDFKPAKDEKKRRLKLYNFAWRNYDFDLKKINKKNHDVSYTI